VVLSKVGLKSGEIYTVITVYTGGVGSGKSYHALLEGLKRVYCIPSKYVVANFPMKLSRNLRKRRREIERWIYMEEIDVDKLIRIAVEKNAIGKESKILLIIDEAGLFFNSRDWMIKSQERKEWIKFFSQSRKIGYDVILVTQESRMIDRQIRSMADQEVKHIRAGSIWYFKILELLFMTKVFITVLYFNRTRLAGIPSIILMLKWIARRYDTMKLFDYKKELISSL